MNKKMILLLFVLCITGVGMFVIVGNIENNKEKPYERETEQTTEKDLVQESETGAETEIETETPSSNVIRQGLLEYELISYEIVEDTEIEQQQAYKKEFFREEELATADYTEEFVDYDAIKEDSPELKELFENKLNYTDAEYAEIRNQHIDVIQKHTVMRHPKTRYLFVKCNITNKSERPNNVLLDLYTFIVSADGKDSIYHDNLCYFDKAVNISDDDRAHRFYEYPFDKNETLECTIGFAIKEEYGPDEQYYVGVVPAGADYVDPEHTENIVKVDKIGD